MIWQLLEIFFNVIAPVFGLVGIGIVAGRKLGLQARTLSRYAYFILIPAFVFEVIGTAVIETGLALRMIGYILVVHAAAAALAYGAGKMGKRPFPMIAAYILIAVFGNNGNFGLPLIEFHLGEEALVPATVYMLAISLFAFVIGVGAANWQKGGRVRAMTAVLKTPAIIALAPALLVNFSGMEMPLLLTRITSLLSGAMIPTMLVTLGVQLSAVKKVQITSDVLIVSGLRLIGAPLLAAGFAMLFGITGVARGAGILQSAMPAAVLTTIIAMEHDLLPDFVTTAVLFSTLASVITLTILMTIL